MDRRALSWLGASAAAMVLAFGGSGVASAATITVYASASASYNGRVTLGSSAYPASSATLQGSWYAVRSSSSTLSCSYNGSSWSCTSTPAAVIKSVAAPFKTFGPSSRWTNSWTSSKCTASSSTWYYYSFVAARVYMSGTGFSADRWVTSAKYVCS